MKIRNIVASSLLTLGMVMALPGPAGAVIVDPADTYEAEVVSATNINRANHHKVQLTPQACVDAYAERQAAWMAANRRLVHQKMRPILRACGLKRVGENIAYGFDSGPVVTVAWMRSKGHRKNILRPAYRLIGVGAVQDANGRWWVSQVFGTAR